MNKNLIEILNDDIDHMRVKSNITKKIYILRYKWCMRTKEEIEKIYEGGE